MLIHFNIKSDPKHWYGMRHIAIFYLGDCEPKDLLEVVDIVKATIDDSIGVVFYIHWDYVSECGTIRLESKMGCDIESIRSACDLVIQKCNTLQL